MSAVTRYYLVVTISPRACHYTGTQGLISILESNTIWASSAAFMNDADEMLSGARAFSTQFEARRAEFTDDEIAHVAGTGILTGTSVFNNFLLSAAEDPDSLTLWRNYGVSEVAYSVEFDTAVRLHPLQIEEGVDHPKPPPGYYDRISDDFTMEGEPISYDPHPDFVLCLGGSWTDVSYIDRENAPEVGAKLDEMLARYRQEKKPGALSFPMYSISNSPLDFLKDRGFKDEAEIRSVHWVNPWWKFVSYRASRFGIVPYIQLTGRADEGLDHAIVASKLPISGVTIGPNAPPLAERALKELLNRTGYGDAWVKRSETPYR